MTIAGTLLLAISAAAPAGIARPSVFSVADARTATILAAINGHPVRLLVDPAASGDLVINPDAAKRAKLSPSNMPITGYIGPVQVRGSWKKANLKVGSSRTPAVVTWYERPVTQLADGIVSPGALPFDEVHLLLGPARPTSSKVSVPVRFSIDFGLAEVQPVPKSELLVRYSLSSPDTIATAAAGAVLARRFGGSWAGDVSSARMKLGISRPVRSLALAAPWRAGPFQISQFLVRTRDWRGTQALPSETDDDPGDIIVTGKSANRQRPFYEFVVGQDRLGSCSSIIYSKRRETLEFVC